MAVLVRPRNVGVRPPAGSGVATGYPLANGLLAAFLFNEGPGVTDVVTGNTRLVPASGTSFGELGLHALAADHGAEVATPAYLQIPLPYTIAAFFTPRGAPDTNSVIFGVLHNNSDSSPFHSYSISFDGSGNVAWRGNTAGTFIDLGTGVSGASLANLPTLAVATYTDAAKEVWINGVVKATSTPSSSPTYGASTLLAGGDYTGVSRNSNIVLHAGYIWNRGLTDSEILDLSTRPYAPVRASSPFRHALTAPAASGAATHRFFAVF